MKFLSVFFLISFTIASICLAQYNYEKWILDPQKALDPFDEKFDWKSLNESPEIDNVKDMMRESKEEAKGRLENREWKK